MKESIEMFLSAEERLAIKKKVREAEALTSGEIVVMAVGASSNYPAAIMAASGSIALVLAVTGALVLRNENLWLFLMLFALFFIVANEVVKRISMLKRLFISRNEITEEVEEAAMKAFYIRKVNETRDRTGILLYISLFEHSVRVLGDSGINSKVSPQAWQEVVDTITRGIGDKRQGEAICAAVTLCGELLQRHFPRKADDRNELGDAMIIG
ncbi:MAG: hypothetical protein HGA97_05310 [Chlorobiaceae bacterium]|nr:hypothetical protein [Chlorobiaceae bacterium]